MLLLSFCGACTEERSDECVALLYGWKFYSTNWSKFAPLKIERMRCCARTKDKWKRCLNPTTFIFCRHHRLGWWLRVSVFIFVSVPAFILLYRGLYNEFGVSDNKTIETHKPAMDSLKINSNPGDININQTNTNGDNNATINNKK